MKPGKIHGLFVILAIAILLNLTLPEHSVTARNGGYLAITQAKSCGDTDPLHPAAALIDGRPETYWGLKPGASEGWTEIGLSQESLILGLEIDGTLGPDSGLTVEYRQDGIWVPFSTGRFRTIPADGEVDLSYDRIVSNALRLHLRDNGISQSRLSGLRILGENAETIFHPIAPKTITGSSNTSPTTPAEFLNDGNTYTIWETAPGRPIDFDYYGWDLESFLRDGYFARFPLGQDLFTKWSKTVGSVVFEFDQSYRFQNINIYFTAESNGEVRFEVPQGRGWREFTRLSKQPAGWYRLDLGEKNLTASRIRVVAEGDRDGAGGIGEIAFWGLGSYGGDRHDPIGSQEPEALVNPINRSFSLDKTDGNCLDLVLDGTSTEPLRVEINGTALTLAPAQSPALQTIYRQLLDPDLLRTGLNFIRVRPQSSPRNLISARITRRSPEGVSPWTIQGDPFPELTDEWLMTPGTAMSGLVINLNRTTLVEEVRICTGDGLPLGLNALVGNTWQPLTESGSTGNALIFKGPALTGQLRLENSAGARISEIQVLGNPINDLAPTVKILWPQDGTVLDINEWGRRKLVGFVDNPEAVVRVNGERVYQNGHYFGVELSRLHLKSGETAKLTATARDPEGRENNDSVEFLLGEMPLLTLDQPEGLSYTDKATYAISGTVKLANCQVTANGIPVPVRNRRFTASLPLEEGFNPIRVTGSLQVDHSQKQFTETEYREVVRYSGTLRLTIDAPLPGSYINAAGTNVTGTVTGLGVCKVTVNGKPAAVRGEVYTASVSLSEGVNRIIVTAVDGSGKSISQQVNVTRDTKAPLLSKVTPVNGTLSSKATVKYSGSVTDANPLWVYVNDQLATITDQTFSADLSFTADGSHSVIIKAQDIAGNETIVPLNVTIDTIPPEAFEVKADPSGWTTNTRPTVIFSTADETSGIDHYELAVDDGAYTRVVSPYQLPALSDGEHIIAVKAFDRAGWTTSGNTKVYIDTTPPVAPAEFKAVPGDGKLIVSWKPNPETDLKKYVLTRIPAFPDDPAKEFGPEVHEFTDTAVENLKEYRYTLKAIDHIDNIGPSVTTPIVKPGLAETTVTPARETELEYENVVITVPAGALTTTKTLAVMEVKDAEPIVEKSLAVNVSPVYEFAATTAQGTVDPGGVQFQKPVIVGIHYNLDDRTKFLKETNLKAYYYNYKDENWEVIPASFVNPETDTVLFLTDHFSMFSVQASVGSSVSPEQVSNMGISPGKAYFQNNQVGISYASGSATVTAKDFVLPGRGGLDLTISRTYDSGQAQADWGLEQNNVFQALFGFFSSGNPFFDFMANFVAQQIDRANGQRKTFGLGRGWRLNFTYIESTEDGQFLHLPGGGSKKINWTMDGSGWGGQGHARFECHAGEHFILEKTQTKTGDVYSSADSQGNRTKIGENWTASGFILTTKDGTRYEMNSSGRLTRVVNRLGTSEINFTYRSDNSEKLDYIIDSAGRKIQFAYNGTEIGSISGAGKTVTYSYDSGLNELKSVNDGGIQVTRYDYEQHSLKSGSQTISLASMIGAIANPAGWVSVIMGLIPSSREDTVYFLSSVKTPFDGEYKISYTEYPAMRYITANLSYTIATYQFSKATLFQELGSAYTKDTRIEYNIVFTNDNPPVVGECNLYEGKKRTYMVFERVSNSVDQDVSLLKSQYVYGESAQLISSHVVENDPNLEAPIRVVDQTGGRNTVQEFKYDNWGNIIWQRNSHTKVEAFYTFANTNAPAISHPLAKSSPFGVNSVNSAIHDARTGELVLNQNGAKVIPQQTWYEYAADGNLLGKAVRSGNNWLTTRYEYDEFGNIIRMTSPSGIATDYDYLAQYNHALLTKVTLERLTDADGKIQSNLVLKELGYDPASFRKRWEKDARGYVTEYQQDTIGRETKTVLPDDDSGESDYYPNVLSGDIPMSGYRSNNPVQTVSYNDGAKTTTVIDPMGNRTDYIYDSFEHLTEIVKFKKALGIPFTYSRVKVRYDNQGNIYEIVSPNGVADADHEYKYRTRYLYDEMNRLSMIIYPDDTETPDDNPTKYYRYNDAANTVTVVDENGHESLTQKDAVDRVVEQDLGLRSEELVTNQYEYDALGNKTSETDGRGNTSYFEYDDQNHLVQKTLPAVVMLNDPDGTVEAAGPVLSYEYDSEGNLIHEISPWGTVTTHVYDEMNREIRTEVSFTALHGRKLTSVTKTYYDLAGNKIKVVDANGKTATMIYTARGWVASSKDASGGITSFSYDKVGNKISETDPRGNAPDAAANSFTAWYDYDELYRVVRAVLPDKTPPANPDYPGDNPVIVFEYDYNGNCVKETKANGQIITYEYNGRNWLMKQTEALNGKSYSTRFEYDKVGNKRFVYDNKNNPTEYRYDTLNRPVLTIFPEGNTSGVDYDQNGNKVAVRDGKYNETGYTYDALNRLSSVADGEGKATFYWYNADGKMTKEQSPPTASSDLGLVTRFYLNELGMALEVKDSLGQSRYFDYDATGNVTYQKDPRGTETHFEYDEMYRVLRMNLENGSRTQALSYDYDLAGNVKRASNGQVDLVYNHADSAYDSDPFNRIGAVREILPDGTSYTTEYRYDIMGQMTGIRYPGSAEWLEYQYDQIGRLVGIPGFAGNQNNPGFTYDENNALQSLRTDNGITTGYQRDKNGRVTGINGAKASGESLLSLTYVFDDANNIIQRNDNSYVYDKVNRLTQATIRGVFEDKFTKADMLLGTADRDYDGTRESEEDVSDATEVKLDYSARSLILDLQTDAENICRVEIAPDQFQHRVPVDQIEIYYRSGFFYNKLERSKWNGIKDANGRITIRFTPVLNTNRIKIHCNYDDLDFLQMPVDRSEFFNSPEKLVTVYQKIVARTETYEYDAMGNRTTEKILLRKEYGWSYEYYPNSNRLKSKVKNDGSEKFEYAYDENGNLISKVVTKGDKIDNWEYSYDLLNQLEQVKKNGEVVSSYIYDPNGFRVEKVGSKGKIHYVPLLNGEVGYRKEFTCGKEYSWIYVGSQKLARVNGTIGSPAHKYFYHNDHLGSCLAITDENGNKVFERDFAPFGEKIKTNDREEPYPDETEDGFTGKDFDEDIGLYYYNARFYDPEIGRFITEDSVTDPKNPHEYVYVANNPINSIDPTGHFTISGLDKVMSGLSTVGKYMNLLGALDPKLAKVASSFNSLVNTLSGLDGVRVLYSKISGNYTISYERTVSAADTGIDGVSYKEKVTQTYKKNKLVASETTQMFMSDAGEVTIVTKNGTSSDSFSQTYTFVSKDRSKTVDKTITFKSGEEGNNQTNIITTEGFVNKNSNNFIDDPFGALMIATTKQGAIGAWQASSLPNSSKYAEIAATTGDPLIMTKMYHKGDPDLYASIGINMTADLLWKTPTEGLNPYPGKLDDQGKVIPGTANPNYNTPFATGIEIHSGDTNTNRGSMGCQTVKPGLNGANWNEFSNAMRLDTLKDGAFIGYYYLIRP